MAAYYRQQATKLRDALNDEAHRTEAVDILRTLINRIELRPATVKGRTTLAIDLHGELAGLYPAGQLGEGTVGSDLRLQQGAELGLMAGRRA